MASLEICCNCVNNLDVAIDQRKTDISLLEDNSLQLNARCSHILCAFIMSVQPVCQSIVYQYPYHYSIPQLNRSVQYSIPQFCIIE